MQILRKSNINTWRSVYFFCFPNYLLHSLTLDRGFLPRCLDIIVTLPLLLEANPRVVGIGYILTTRSSSISIYKNQDNRPSNRVFSIEVFLKTAL